MPRATKRLFSRKVSYGFTSFASYASINRFAENAFRVRTYIICLYTHGYSHTDHQTLEWRTFLMDFCKGHTCHKTCSKICIHAMNQSYTRSLPNRPLHYHVQSLSPQTVDHTRLRRIRFTVILSFFLLLLKFQSSGGIRNGEDFFCFVNRK